jgi:hypothetical protein
MTSFHYDAPVSEAGEGMRYAHPRHAAEVRPDDQQRDEWDELRPILHWISRRRPILIGSIVLIAAQLFWRAHLLHHLYFRQDDFFNLDLAAQSPLSWHYLTFVGVGHFMIGQRILVWLLVRTSLYNWGLASAVSLVLVACADLAALRLLRSMFGERPATLALLTIYLLYPLALPDFGYWTAATESIPFQLAIFMALNAHVCYVRSGRRRHLAAAAAWVAFGLIFLEKGLVLPPLLFLVTAAFLVDTKSMLTGLGRALVRFRIAWLVYAAILACYITLLTIALRTAASRPQLPRSAAAVWTYIGAAIRKSLVPGMVGGPWQWLRAGGSYVLAAPPAALAWLAVGIVLLVVAASIAARKAAWRAWAILAIWVIGADLVPVILRRVNGSFPVLFGLDTRYMAETGALLVICLGLAFIPLTEVTPMASTVATPEARVRERGASSYGQAIRAATAGLLAMFIVGSVWSSQAYANATTGKPAARYIANATSAIGSAQPGTTVVPTYVPADIFVGYFETYGLTSTVIGDIDRGRLQWPRHPAGTIDGLQIFGADGKLHPAFVYGSSTGKHKGRHACWPTRHGRIVIGFLGSPPFLSTTLRIGYLWGSDSSSVVDVRYGSKIEQLPVEPGLHSGYLPISGTAARVVVTAPGGSGLCIGDVEAGDFAPVRG